MSKHDKITAVFLIFLILFDFGIFIYARCSSENIVDEPVEEERPIVYDRPALTEPEHIIIEGALP